MSACCRIGALLGRASPEQVEGLTRYGLDIGIAFQISDDSLDFVADQARLGKAVGADLKEGKRTLPLIATIERVGPADRDRIHALLQQPALIPEEIEEIRRLVVKHAGVEYALERAHEYAQSAKDSLGSFPSSEDKETLVLVADFVVDRDR
jgi:octaprenyl-diphosphate synthase